MFARNSLLSRFASWMRRFCSSSSSARTRIASTRKRGRKSMIVARAMFAPVHGKRAWWVSAGISSPVLLRYVHSNE